METKLLMKKYLALFAFALMFTQGISQDLKSPEEFLGYKLGERFTRHHKIVEYYRHVADVMPNVVVQKYGETNEHRPLLIATLTSLENFNRLEEIRKNNLMRTGILEGSATDEQISIVWLSYNVHGNESSSSEATMQTLYELADPNNKKTQKWLENTVVIMDPCINPDGRDRYANFYNQYGNRVPNPDLDSKEHREPWPGGRANHYLFDLNRDWAWLTQVESAQRLEVYNQWMPHVHVDFHEQGLNNPYYFPPAAEPYHEIITPWQREFQKLIGENHARYFDEEGWLYFTKEVFDLFYPSYGDTYPTYNGAIGMTYEKGGGGRAGLAGLMSNKDTVTLHDRLLHHHTTGLSTVEVSSVNATRLVSEFESYYNKAQNSPDARYKTYVIKGSNHPDKMKTLAEWLDKHQIDFGKGTSGSRKLTGFSYQSGTNGSVSIGSNDMIISTYQPKSNLITALFEPNPSLVDSMTYDITAWAVPYMYDLEAYALTEKVNVTSPYSVEYTLPEMGVGKPYAYVAAYETLNDVKWMAWLLNNGVKIRVSEKDFNVEGQSYRKGTLVALRWDNEHLEGFYELVKEATIKFGQDTKTIKTGLVNLGKDFGSRYYKLIEAPKVAVLSGSEVSSLAFGEVWYYFEQDVEYPVTVLDIDYFARVDLSNYDVLVVPNGYYRIFNEGKRKDLVQWVRDGGRLVVVGNALRSFVNTDQFGLTKYISDEDKTKAEKMEEELEEGRILMDYEDESRLRVSNNTPGAIYRVKMDNSHPLAFGYPQQYFTLKRSGSRYSYLKDGWNVGIIESANDHVSGFVGKNIEDSLAETLVEMGSGSVVYMVDNPLFRAFWQNGKMIFGNAVFMK
jgi:hypothetical protein